MIIKNLKKYFTFEVQVQAQHQNALHSLRCGFPPTLMTGIDLYTFQVLDDKNVRRRFRASNYQSTTRVKPFICTMPMRLDDGWNQIQFNLSDFTRRAYGTNYIETLRVQVSASASPKTLIFKFLTFFFFFIWFLDPCQLSNTSGVFLGPTVL